MLRSISSKQFSTASFGFYLEEDWKVATDTLTEILREMPFLQYVTFIPVPFPTEQFGRFEHHLRAALPNLDTVKLAENVYNDWSNSFED